MRLARTRLTHEKDDTAASHGHNEIGSYAPPGPVEDVVASELSRSGNKCRAMVRRKGTICAGVNVAPAAASSGGSGTLICLATSRRPGPMPLPSTLSAL